MDLGEPADGVGPFEVRMLHEIMFDRANLCVDSPPARKLSVPARLMTYIMPPERWGSDFSSCGPRARRDELHS
jgi:hypothetical protein